MFALATTVELMAGVCRVGVDAVCCRVPRHGRAGRRWGTTSVEGFHGIRGARRRPGGFVARSAVIAPLTGLRLVAAVWVVLFHIYLFNGDDLSAAHPRVDAVVGPIVSQGDLGVDLFFLLSGFVLACNYLERLG